VTLSFDMIITLKSHYFLNDWILIQINVLLKKSKFEIKELKTQEKNNADPFFVPENIKSLRYRNVTIYSQYVQSKFLKTHLLIFHIIS
jgi:hypothetical protein